MDKIQDTYGGCEEGCTHDLHRGVLVADLKDEGPYPDTSMLLNAGWLAARISEAAIHTTIDQVTDSRVGT